MNKQIVKRRNMSALAFDGITFSSWSWTKNLTSNHGFWSQIRQIGNIIDAIKRMFTKSKWLGRGHSGHKHCTSQSHDQRKCSIYACPRLERRIWSLSNCQWSNNPKMKRFQANQRNNHGHLQSGNSQVSHFRWCNKHNRNHKCVK
jgi:hypothetical protein